MLIVGYWLGIRSERQLCNEAHLNLAYRWFCSSDSTAEYRIIPHYLRIAMAASATATSCVAYSRLCSLSASLRVWSVAKTLPSTVA